VRFQVTQANKTAMQGAIVSIKQFKSDFPFGCGMNHIILKSTDYQNWFASRFKFTTFTNEMKWYSTEKKQGHENYTVPDAMVKFAKQNGISIRGHNIFWDDPKYQPDWVKSLSPQDLRKAAEKRINSVVSRYSGQLIAWDVVNENVHFRFFEDKLGENASAEFYSTAYQLDPNAIMFMNEYNTIEYSEDQTVSAANYKKKLEEILQYPGNDRILAGIGLQGRFGSGQPNLAYMRSSLDILGAIGVPIWLTEVNVDKDPDQVFQS
jgi:GH35 family endo-1,4-beta-xylanase